jgi:hypothetical protein
VQHAFLQRSFVVLLMIARLFFGEAAHAHATEAAHTVEHATAAMTLDGHCPDDANQHDERSAHEDASTEDASTSEDSQHCCESGDCECPGLNTAAASVVMSVPALTLRQALNIAPKSGALCDWPSRVFRPPA